MFRSILFLLSLAVALCNPFSAKAQGEKRITILYDAFGPPSSLKMDWGFAALIEYNGRRILFDAGNNAKIFEHNINQLNVDLTRLDAVVISHRHGDHTSGLNHLVRVNPSVKIYAQLRGSSVGVREAAKNRVPRKPPPVENEYHGPVPIWAHLSIPGERGLRVHKSVGRFFGRT